MLQTVEVIFGAKSPMALRDTLTQSSFDPNPPDFTLAASARLVVRDKEGHEVTWVPTLSALTTTTALATYVFAADGSDLAHEKTYLVTPWVAFTGIGERACEPFNLVVTRTP